MLLLYFSQGKFKSILIGSEVPGEVQPSVELVPWLPTLLALVSYAALVFLPLESSFLLLLLLARDDNKMNYFFFLVDLLYVAQPNEHCLSFWFLGRPCTYS